MNSLSAAIIDKQHCKLLSQEGESRQRSCIGLPPCPGMAVPLRRNKITSSPTIGLLQAGAHGPPTLAQTAMAWVAG